MENARRVQSHLFDRTHGNAPTVTPGYSQRLNGSANEKFGLARSLSVMPGDVVTAEVYAKYLDLTRDNWATALANFIAAIAGGTAPAGTVVDGSGMANSTASFPFAGLRGTDGQENTGPRGYLNWLVFDRNYQFIAGQSGYRRLSTAAREFGQDAPHERLQMPPITIREPGYVYIYISNEEATPVEIYFDDFTVTHTQSPVIQTDEYYPFGLAFNSYSRENSTPNQYLYNGKELISDLGIEEYDFGFRQYDPAIARWKVVDPMAHLRDWVSPYNFVQNNPINRVDPDGRLDDWVERSDGKIYWDENATSQATTKEGEKYLGKAVVVFEGSKDEKLGKGQSLLGEGANLAKATVYGPRGRNDIKTYDGYTMSSDPTKFGIVAEGNYTVNRIGPNEKRGPYNSEWTLNNRGKVPAEGGFNPAFPDRRPGYLDGVFVHRSNNNGWAGTFMKNEQLHGVSQGCLLIAPIQWDIFNKQLNSVNNFQLQLKR